MAPTYLSQNCQLVSSTIGFAVVYIQPGTEDTYSLAEVDIYKQPRTLPTRLINY